MSATSFAGNFTGVASGITGTPNIVVGIMTGTLNGDGSSLTGIAATNWIANNVTANSSTTTVDLALGNVVKFTQSANTTVSFANTGTSNIVSFIRIKDSNATTRTLTWPSSIKWDGGSAPDLVQINPSGEEFDLITLLTRDEGVTWYGWLTSSNSRTDSNLFIWGNLSDYGANLQNNLIEYSSPVQVPGTNWRSVTSSRETGVTLATKTDGTLWAGGRNEFGNLGQNNRTYYSSPVQIPGTTWSANITTSNGTDAQAGAVKTDGTLWIWGKNSFGGLGLNESASPSSANSKSSPTQIGSGTDWNTTPRTFSSGSNYSVATKTDGTLWAWGYNDYGNMGDNDRTRRSSPTQIPGSTWNKVSAFFVTTLAIKTNGELWAWGNNDEGQLGQSNKTQYSSPVQIPGTTWQDVAMGYQQAIATKTDNTMWAWGSNEYGILGINNQTNYSSPKQVPGSWILPIAGQHFSGGVKTDGTLWMWGRNDGDAVGSLGQNNQTQYSSPIQVPGTWGTTVGQVGANYGGMRGIKEQ